jgi:hypothetical protein
MLRLSHSSIRLWTECPKKFDYHYNQRIRENSKSGALYFGSALDKAFEIMCKGGTKEEAIAAFTQLMREGDINGEGIFIPTEERVVYSKTDYDEELVGYDITKAAKVKEALDKKHNGAGHWGLTKEERLLANEACWDSLYKKGLILIDTLVEEVMPRIREVVATQKKLELTNGNDSLVGYPDLIARLDDGLLYLLDLKTSSRPYDTDSVATSQQLTIYDEALKQEGITVDRHGFIVLLKKLKKTIKKTCTICGFSPDNNRAKTCTNEASGKRCGGEWKETTSFKGEVQWVTDRIPDRSKDIILENVDAINHAISAGVFTRNFNSCEGQFGRCAFYDLCWKDKMTNLVKA